MNKAFHLNFKEMYKFSKHFDLLNGAARSVVFVAKYS